MKSATEWTIDVLLVSGSTLYTVTALCCIWAMWKMRKHFFMALRSPLLGCLVGTTYTLRSCTGTYVILLELYAPSPSGHIQLTGVVAGLRIIFGPATLVSTGAIIACVLRILVMYDPVKRRKYGRYTKEERVFQALVWTFVLLEVGAWSTACVTGAEWIARRVSILDLLSMLATLVAAVLLSGQLRKVHDICQLSRDTQRLGALVLWTIGVYIITTFLPLPAFAYKYMVATRYIITLQPVAWAINIKPVIDYLRQGESSGSARDGILALLVPWAWLWRWVTDSGNGSGRVACTVAAASGHRLKGLGSSSAMGNLHETPLAAVMEFPPLRQAFGGYCQKALCSESFQFLVDVSEFSSLVYRTSRGDERGGKDDFDEFNVIVGEYITDNSNSEINIDSGTKKKLRGFCERSAYASLDQDDRANIFFQAEKEIANMLADNLLNTFKATAEYKELVGNIEFGAYIVISSELPIKRRWPQAPSFAEGSR